MARHKSRILHYWMLKAVNVCDVQLRLFRMVFGYSCAVNKKNLIKARKAGLWIFWFMDNFVGDENREAFQKIVDEEYHYRPYNPEHNDFIDVGRIIDQFLVLFESNHNSYSWAEHPF